MARKRAPRSTHTPPPAPHQARAWAPILIVAASGLAYASSFRGAFVFDDLYTVVQNEHLRGSGLDLFAAPPETPAAGRPFVSLTLALNHSLGGLEPWGYHLLNLVVHVGAALALFGCVRRTFLTPRLAGRFGPAAGGLALATALIFALHPLQTESVTYVSQRAESLMAFFYLLTLYASLRSFASRHGSEPTGRVWVAVAIGACCLGMACKEVMVSAPLLVLLHDRIFVAGSFRAALHRSRTLYAGLAASWLLLAGLAASAPRGVTAGFGRGVLAADYLKIQCGALVHYLRLFFWPHPLCFDYEGWPVPALSPGFLCRAVFVAALVAATAWGLWRAAPWAFLGAWWFAILAPSSSVVPVVTEVVAEHRVYLPLAALAVLVVVAGHAALARLAASGIVRPAARRALATGAVGLLAVALGVATGARNRVYSSEQALWEDTVRVRPDNPRAHNNLGTSHAHAHENAAALRSFAEALRLRPRYADAHNNAGHVLASLQREDEAIAHYRAAVAVQPDDTRFLLPALRRRGITLLAEARFDAAIAAFEEALRFEPGDADSHNNLGIALSRAGRIPEALPHHRAAVAARPQHAELHHNLACTLADLGRLEEAVAEFEATLRLDAGYGNARTQLDRARSELATRAKR